MHLLQGNMSTGAAMETCSAMMSLVNTTTRLRSPGEMQHAMAADGNKSHMSAESSVRAWGNGRGEGQPWYRNC